MRLTKSLLLSLTSTALKLFASLATLPFVARSLGPSTFGELMLAMSVATLLAVVSNLGLVNYILVEASGAIDAARVEIESAISAKFTVSILIIITSFIALWLMPIPSFWMYIILLIAFVIEGYTEIQWAVLRARERYDVEVRLSVLSSTLHASFVLTGASLSDPVFTIPLGYLTSRILVQAATFYSVRQVISYSSGLKWGALSFRARKMMAFAGDSIMTSGMSQIDSIFLGASVSSVSVGIYQAGMRLFLAGTQVAPVLANVFLPRLSRSSLQGKEKKEREAFLVQAAFFGYGIGFAILLSYGASSVVDIIYGDQFEDLKDLMPWFAVIFTMKFSTAALGIILTATGKQKMRTWTNAVQWAIVVFLAMILVPSHGVHGWLASIAIGTGALYVMYLRAGVSGNRHRLLCLLGAILAILVVLPPAIEG